MSSTKTNELEEPRPNLGRVVNDFSITVATINGSGSQTSNLTLLRALFKMGIPVSGKNLFPSNIQGLPTWYTIRVNKDGFLARRDVNEIMVAMNPASFAQDLASVVPGGAFLYADHIRMPVDRDDISVYRMPVKQISKESNAPTELRDYIANMVYVGVLSYLLGIDMDKISKALDFHFKSNAKAIKLNLDVVNNAYRWAEENLEKSDPFIVEEMDLTKDYIMTDGNTAAAFGAIYGGIQFAAWYPITPATSLAEKLVEYLPVLRKDPENPDKNTFAVIQAEDELAALGMTIGAGWAGLRSMTSTSGPGISLMAEYSGLAYFAEVPVVIWDVQRVGPSTGMPTRTAQCDITFIHFLGHGDTHQIMLIPGSVNECFEFGWRAFDLAEKFQTPVFVLSDLDFGMNQWMTAPFKYPDTPMDRGKVLWEEDIERLKGDWGRYRDVDGDGIAYRTLPGNRHPQSSYFARGTGHDENARYTEDNDKWHALMDRLKRKYDLARDSMPEPISEIDKNADVGLIYFGSVEPAIKEARHVLLEKGLPTSSMRLRAVPFSNKIEKFIADHERVYIVEMNRDGQMHQLLTIEYPQLATKLISIAFMDGLPLTAKYIYEAIIANEEKS